MNLLSLTGKREKAALSEVEKACTSKIIAAEEALKKKKQVGVDIATEYYYFYSISPSEPSWILTLVDSSNKGLSLCYI